MPLVVPVILKFVLVIIFTFAGSFIFYEFVIRRIWFIRPLFGLKNSKLRKAEYQPGKSGNYRLAGKIHSTFND
jgi:hypothetical protein